MRFKQFYYNNKLHIFLFLLFVANGFIFFLLGTRYNPGDMISSSSSHKSPVVIKDERNMDLIVVKSAFSPHFNFLAHNLKNSKYVSESFKKNGLWESPQSGFIEDLFKNIAPKGSSFIEVGANIGWFTMLVANTGQFTYAIEPYTYNVELFKANMAMNPHLAKNIHLTTKAVMGPSFKKPRVCMIPYFSSAKENEDNAQAVPSDIECKNPSGEIVEVSTIDNELLDIVDKKPFLMNFDIEGYEFEALKGAEKFLRKFSPCYIIVDMDHVKVAGTDPDTITSWMKTKGYDLCLHTIDRDKLYQHRSCSEFSAKLQECETVA